MQAFAAHAPNCKLNKLEQGFTSLGKDFQM
jgi:hypothetical protein